MKRSYNDLLLVPIMDALSMIGGRPGRVLFVDERTYRRKRRKLLRCLKLVTVKAA